MTESERSMVTWLYQATTTSIDRHCARIDYEVDIDECSLGLNFILLFKMPVVKQNIISF